MKIVPLALAFAPSVILVRIAVALLFVPLLPLILIRRWPMMRDMALACIGCPFYDPDFGCLGEWERLHCPQYVPSKEVR